MTNEELIEQYRHDPNDVETVHQLYQQSRKLIRKLATECARSFHCLFYRDNGKDYTAYTDSVMDELVSEGTVALIEVIQSDRYAPDAGKFSTYVYPFIKGAMHRWLENNIGAVAVSKHEMQKVRQAQQMYNEGIPINEITQSMKLSEAQLSQLLNYNTHALSLDQLIEDDFSFEGGEQPRCSMEYTVMLKIWLSLLPEVFEKLKKRTSTFWDTSTVSTDTKRNLWTRWLWNWNLLPPVSIKQGITPSDICRNCIATVIYTSGAGRTT